ncbi:MAG: hypothetical protein ACOY99_11305 [Pseudomonadota bacterium]
MTTFLKDPQATLDYSIEWADAGFAGQTILTSNWSLSPQEEGGLAILGEALDGTKASVTLAAGIKRHAYRVANRIALSGGLVEERSFTILVDER